MGALHVCAQAFMCTHMSMHTHAYAENAGYPVLSHLAYPTEASPLIEAGAYCILVSLVDL